MFTRGGVYRVVKEAMGGTLGKLSVSALIFDYVLTGPISGVSAGQYVVGLAAQTLTLLGHPWAPSPSVTNALSALVAVAVTLYFWRRNTRGLHESSTDALRIMGVTTAMVVALIAWSGLTIALNAEQRRLPPAPLPENLSFDRDAVGWLPDLVPGGFVDAGREGAADGERRRLPVPTGSLLGLLGILVAFGHSLLAMSGEESLAQVNRELEYPKHKNLMRAGLVIFAYSLLFTSLVSFIAYAVIPDEQRAFYKDNLISGIAMFMVGPTWLKLLFQAFIVLVGFLMLSGAINTSIIGATGVLSRVSEDGVMPAWFRKPHPRYGTAYRVINLIALLQIAAILGSNGDTYTLGEAYAFGVVWSFAFKALATLVLRFKDRAPREWKVPMNLRWKGGELPIGLAAIAGVLFLLAAVNLVTKRVATVSGLGFTAVFFVLFVASERIGRRRSAGPPREVRDEFRLDAQDAITAASVGVRPGNTLCVVRDDTRLDHLRYALEETHTGKRDLVVLTVRVTQGPDAGYENLAEHRVFSGYEQGLFSRVVALAEKAGKTVHLLVVPSSNVHDAIVQTAVQIASALVVAGPSSVVPASEQARRLGEAWERLARRPPRGVTVRVVPRDGVAEEFVLGQHPPRLVEADLERIHALWLDVTRTEGITDLHHRDVVAVAVGRLAEQLKGAGRTEVIEEFRRLPRG